MTGERKMEDPWVAFVTDIGQVFTTIKVEKKDIEAIDELGVNHSFFDQIIWGRPKKKESKLIEDPKTGKTLVQTSVEYEPICKEFDNGTPLLELAQVLFAPAVWGAEYLLPQAYENAVDADRMAGMLKYRTMATFMRNPEDWAWYLTFLDIFHPREGVKKTEAEKENGYRNEQKEYLRYLEDHIPYIQDSLYRNTIDIIKGLVDYLGKDKERYGG